MANEDCYVKFGDSIVTTLKYMADQRDTSISEIISQAVGLYHTAFTNAQAGGKLLMEKPNGQLVELLVEK